MPRKKHSPNAFTLFVSDWKKQHGNEGLREAEVLKLCEDVWKNCPEKHDHYRLLAMRVKGKSKLNVEFQYTCTGESYQPIKAETKEAQEFIIQMVQEIKTTISELSAICIEALINHRFYFIHANYYIEWTTENRFIPCEVAIAEYSIFEGIVDVLHFFPAVDTPDGNLPLGYAFEANDKASTSHGIPPPPFEPAEYDFQDLSSRVLNFLTRNGSTAIPPVYTMNDNVNCNYSKSTVCDFMNLVLDFTGERVRVYRLPLLLTELINACSTCGLGKESLSDVNFEEVLSIDPFLYEQGIACEYHTLLESDAQRFCSKSTVQRWAYIFSKYCCQEVGIEQIQGKHCPLQSSEETVTMPKGLFCNEGASGGPKERKLSSSEKRNAGGEHDKPLFQRPKPDLSSAPIYKFGKQAGVVSEIRPDETSKFVEGTGVRLPQTRGRADLLIARQKSADVRGFSKDEFPALGKAKVNPVPWKPEEPRALAKEDFPSLGGPSCSRKCGRK